MRLGLGGAGVAWYRTLPALAGHYDVIALDLWGPRRYQGQALTLETGVQFIGGLLEAGASGE